MDENAALMANLLAIMASSLRMASPLIIAALGECLVQRAGLINIGLEGTMLAGAFTGFLVCYNTASPGLGLLAAIGVGLLFAAIFALVTIVFRGDQIVAGTALNILALGLTGTIYKAIFGTTGTELAVQTFPILKFPTFWRLPYAGPVLFEHNILVYSVLPLTLAIWFWMTRTRKGIELVALGEHPRAADAVGIRVNVQRFAYVLFGGALGGAAGAYLSLAHANTFVENMTNGRGFIAIAIVILGRWRPFGILMGSLFFGLAEALQFHVQALNLNIPYQFILMLPYVLTVIVLADLVRGARAPRAMGRPYIRE